MGMSRLPAPQVLNTQRDKVYGQRRRALLSSDLSSQMIEFAERTVDDILEVRSLSVTSQNGARSLAMRKRCNGADDPAQPAVRAVGTLVVGEQLKKALCCQQHLKQSVLPCRAARPM